MDSNPYLELIAERITAMEHAEQEQAKNEERAANLITMLPEDLRWIGTQVNMWSFIAGLNAATKGDHRNCIDRLTAKMNRGLPKFRALTSGKIGPAFAVPFQPTENASIN